MLDFYTSNLNIIISNRDYREPEPGFSIIANFMSDIDNVLFVNLTYWKNNNISKHSMRVITFDVNDDIKNIKNIISENLFNISYIFIDLSIVQMSIIKNLFDYVTSLGKTVVVRVPQQVYVKMTGFTHFTFEIDHRDVYDYQRDEKLTINDLKQRWLIDEKIKSIGL